MTIAALKRNRTSFRRFGAEHLVPPATDERGPCGPMLVHGLAKAPRLGEVRPQELHLELLGTSLSHGGARSDTQGHITLKLDAKRGRGSQLRGAAIKLEQCSARRKCEAAAFDLSIPRPPVATQPGGSPRSRLSRCRHTPERREQVPEGSQRLVCRIAVGGPAVFAAKNQLHQRPMSVRAQRFEREGGFHLARPVPVAAD